jgi:hypothetical protein
MRAIRGLASSAWTTGARGDATTKAAPTVPAASAVSSASVESSSSLVLAALRALSSRPGDPAVAAVKNPQRLVEDARERRQPGRIDRARGAALHEADVGLAARQPAQRLD